MPEVQKLPVSEIFGPTIQGEGMHAGRRAVFLRMAGCDSRCPWCDTPYAKTTKECMPLTPKEILDEIERLNEGANLVIITGGNPAIHDLAYIVARLKSKRFEVHVETQGTIVAFWFDRCDLVTVCPKIYNSQDVVMAHNNINKIRQMAPTQLKYVIFTEADYTTAQELARCWPTLPFVFQPGWDAQTNSYPYGLKELAERMMKDKFLPNTVRFMPQIHRILWGGVRGV